VVCVAGFVGIVAGSILVGSLKFFSSVMNGVERFRIGVGSNALLQWLHYEQRWISPHHSLRRSFWWCLECNSGLHMCVLAVLWCVWWQCAHGDGCGNKRWPNESIWKSRNFQGHHENLYFWVSNPWLVFNWSWQVLVAILKLCNTQHVQWIVQVSLCVGKWK